MIEDIAERQHRPSGLVSLQRAAGRVNRPTTARLLSGAQNGFGADAAGIGPVDGGRVR